MKITVQQDCRSTTLKLEGRLVGPWVEEVERAWRAEAGSSKDKYLQIDLSEVTLIDTRGKELLAQMYEGGVDLVAGTPMMIRGIVEEVTRDQRSPKRK